jgi:hypothetical protein
MEAALAVELREALDRRPAEVAMRAAAARVIGRTRLAWAAGPAVSTRRSARPTLELKASRALDNQPWTGD